MSLCNSTIELEQDSDKDSSVSSESQLCCLQTHGTPEGTISMSPECFHTRSQMNKPNNKPMHPDVHW